MSYTGWIPAIKNIEGMRVNLVEHNTLGKKFNECTDPEAKENLYLAIKDVHKLIKERIKFITRIIDSLDPTDEDILRYDCNCCYPKI